MSTTKLDMQYVLSEAYHGTSHSLKNILVSSAGNVLIGQQVMASSVPVCLASDQQLIDIGNVEIVDASSNALIGQHVMASSLPVVLASNHSTINIFGDVTNPVLHNVYETVSDTLKVLIMDYTGANYIGQRVMASSLPVAIAANQSPITTLNVTISSVYNSGSTGFKNFLVDNIGSQLINQKTMASSVPVVIASNQSSVTINGIVSNTTISSVYNSGSSALKNLIVDNVGAGMVGQKAMVSSLPVVIANNQSSIQVNGTIANTTVSSAYDSGATAFQVLLVNNLGSNLLGQMVMASCLPVVIASNQSAVPTQGLKQLSDPAILRVATNPTTLSVTAGAEIVWLNNDSGNTAEFYIGYTAAVSTISGAPCLKKGEELPAYPCSGATNIFFASTVTTDDIGYIFFGRS